MGNYSRQSFRADFVEPLEPRRLLSAGIFQGGIQPQHLSVLGNELIFSAVDSTHGRELWSSEGTGKTTHLLADLNPGTDSSTDETPPPAYPVTPNDWLAVGNVLYFSGHDAKGTGLFRTDGTVGGTYKIAAMGKPEHLVSIGNTLYFDDGANLWRSDGTSPGTTEITGSGNLKFSKIFEIHPLNQTIYFAAADPSNSNDYDLVASDGTTTGTTILHRYVVPKSKYVGVMSVLKNTLIFQAPDSNGDGGEALWESDGTIAGTKQLVSILSSEKDDLAESFVFDKTIYFFLSEESAGTVLYRTDGTAAGTVKLQLIDSSNFNLSSIPHIGSIGSELYFSNDGDNGPEVWETNGSKSGTKIVATMDWLIDDSFDGSWISTKFGIYFATDNHGPGFSVWNFTGKASGLQRLASTTSLASDLGPELTVFNNHLYFAAVDDLWQSSLYPPSTVRGIVFTDENDNGILDDNEIPEDTVKPNQVWLDLNNNGIEDSTDPHTHTDEFGRYIIKVDAVGTFPIHVIPYSGYTISTPQPIEAILSPTQNAHVNVGQFKPAEITGTVYDNTLPRFVVTLPHKPLSDVEVYLDTNGNGQLDPGEPRARTHSNGSFKFENLTGGTYIVRQASLGSDWVVQGKNKEIEAITAAQSVHVVFGDWKQAYQVKVHAFVDTNHNGKQDAGEPIVTDAGGYVDANLNGSDDDGDEVRFPMSVNDEDGEIDLPAGTWKLVPYPSFDPENLHASSVTIHVSGNMTVTFAYS